jgi:hypothetical protein
MVYTYAPVPGYGLQPWHQAPLPYQAPAPEPELGDDWEEEMDEDSHWQDFEAFLDDNLEMRDLLVKATEDEEFWADFR